MKKVAIINYGMGNINSVFNAFKETGHYIEIVTNPKRLCNYDSIVLPGVGSFGEGMQHLISGNWIDELNKEVLCKKKPFFGICLGMQLLATNGEEYGNNKGLNWIKGTVQRIESKNNIRIPHIGWNDVNFIDKNRDKNSIYKSLKDSQVFYFVNSYVLIPNDKSIISGTFTYENEYVASIELDNIYAVQFHPEKSHKTGLTVIKNFVELK